MKIIANAQWTDNGSSLTTNDKVGIGTSSPAATLDVNGDIKSNSTTYNYYNVINLSSQDVNIWYPIVLAANGPGGPVLFDIVRNAVHEDGNWYGTLHFEGMFNSSGWGNSNNQFRYEYEEHTNTSPGGLVWYVGHQYHGGHIIVYLRGGRHYYIKSNTQIENRSSIGSAYTMDTWDVSVQITVSPSSNTSSYPPVSIPAGGTETITWRKVQSNVTLSSGGNIIIGKSYQANPSYKLDVNGDIRANKVVVNTMGADFVFDSTYQLSSLDSLENYISTHHHLPGVSTAQEMQKDGMDLGSFCTLLLKKNEELTLYIMNMNKKQQMLEKQIAELKKDKKAIEKSCNRKNLYNSRQ